MIENASGTKLQGKAASRQWMQATVVYSAEHPELVQELISAAFMDLGLSGVVIDDPSITLGDSRGEDAPGQPKQPAVSAYFPLDADFAGRRERLLQALKRLAAQHALDYRITWRWIAGQNWAESWKVHFKPRRISERLVVKPSWCEFSARGEDIVIEIDPGMAFGSGTHATTALCLRMLEKYLAAGQTFLDVGTGSGILMVAAAGLGAARVCGGDSDLVALQTAAENLRRNGVSRRQYDLFAASLVDSLGRAAAFGILAANILPPVILHLLDDVRRVLRPGGVLICSGFLAKHRSAVAARMDENGIAVIDAAEQEGWVCLVGRSV